MQDDQLDEVARWIEEGVLESSGHFTLSLADARSKLAQFSQVDPSLWTLKIFQAFCLLGCSHLKVEQEAKEVFFRGLSPKRPLDPARVQLNLSELALTGEVTPEQCLAWALVGLPELEGVRVMDTVIFGQAEERPTDTQGEIWLALAYPQPPKFPLELWTSRCWAAPMSWSYELGLWARLQRLAVTELSPAPDHWLEAYRICAERPALAPHSQGQAGIDLGRLPAPARQNRTTCLYRCGEATAAPGQDVMVFVLPSFEGHSLVYPVQAGVLLQPLSIEGLPDGLKVYFAADGVGTDLSQFRLRQDEALQLRLQQLLADLPELLEPLARQWSEWGRKLVDVPRNSPLMDLAPGFLGALGALFTVTFPLGAGLFIGGLCCMGPSAAYFAYSRSLRRREYQALLDQWQARTVALHEELRRLAGA